MKASMTLNLAPYLEDLAQAGQDVDKIITEVLTEAAPQAKADMETELRKTSEQYTGATAETLFATDVQRDGNFIYFEMGADTTKDPAGLYKEFGRIRQNAEPFFRPVLTKIRKSGIKNMLKEIFEKLGIET